MIWAGVLGVLYGALHEARCMSAFALLVIIGMRMDRKEERERCGKTGFVKNWFSLL